MSKPVSFEGSPVLLGEIPVQDLQNQNRVNYALLNEPIQDKVSFSGSQQQEAEEKSPSGTGTLVAGAGLGAAGTAGTVALVRAAKKGAQEGGEKTSQVVASSTQPLQEAAKKARLANQAAIKEAQTKAKDAVKKRFLVDFSSLGSLRKNGHLTEKQVKNIVKFYRSQVDRSLGKSKGFLSKMASPIKWTFRQINQGYARERRVGTGIANLVPGVKINPNGGVAKTVQVLGHAWADPHAVVALVPRLASYAEKFAFFQEGGPGRAVVENANKFRETARHVTQVEDGVVDAAKNAFTEGTQGNHWWKFWAKGGEAVSKEAGEKMIQEGTEKLIKEGSEKLTQETGEKIVNGLKDDAMRLGKKLVKTVVT